MYLAHLAEDQREQTVLEHLEGTAARSERFAAAFGMGEQGRLLGLAHDVGKCSHEFQERLRGGRIVDHATAGALECAKLDATWAAFCVAGHHGGLPDGGNLRNDSAADLTLIGRLRRGQDRQIPPYELPLRLEAVPAPQGYGQSRLVDSFTIRMLYSCLVDADYLDTEQFMSGLEAETPPGETIPALLEKLERHIAPWQHPSNSLNRQRCAILNACLKGGARERGLFTLTAPTGGGKTVASMAFALRHAARHGMERVIYVIPYTSIIEQTADTFRKIFGKENVLEHHSNVSLEPNEGDSTDRYQTLGVMENWDAPIIVTTAVQFFESLYANRPAKCRKLHRIANSVLIFDEAQMLPTEHLRPCVAAIAKLVERFRSSAVLCTATQPTLNDLFAEYAPGCAITELCPDPAVLFRQLRRVSFAQIGKLDAEALAEHLAAHSQVLCIVNSRRGAQEVYQKLPKDGSYHLSTLMYPAHRRAVLEEIRLRLKEGLPCRVVSTSLIEAGVDVDFPAVYREIAGLDSILQAAGRCNREGGEKPEDSVVTVFEGVSAVPQLLRVNIGAAKETLRAGLDPAYPETVARYFRAYRSLMQASSLDKYAVIRSFERGIAGNSLPFRTVAERFHLIDDRSVTVYIPLEKGAELIQRLDAGERTRALFRLLGQYSVSIYPQQERALLERGVLTPLDESSAILRNPALYDEKLGLNVGEAELPLSFLAV